MAARHAFGVRRQRQRFGFLRISAALSQSGVALRLPLHSKKDLAGVSIDALSPLTQAQFLVEFVILGLRSLCSLTWGHYLPRLPRSRLFCLA
jgi:hypothetical protein